MVDTIEKTANYRSLVGGYFSKTPGDLSMKRSIRTNNPLALNISPWQKSFPGYVGYTQADNSPNANKTTIYETPENGFAAWYELMRRYADGGHDTVGEIITRYGGGQDYSGYLAYVRARTGFTDQTQIKLTDDVQLLALAKAMAAHEAGQALPWSDQQILYGIKLGRQYAGGAIAPAPAPSPQVPTAHTTTTETGGGFWALLTSLLAWLMGTTTVSSPRVMSMGDSSPKGGDVWKLQEKLREIGFVDIVIDGQFGRITDRAVRTFQDRENLDPDGEVGPMTLEALRRVSGVTVAKPPLLPPPAIVNGQPSFKPSWYALAEKEIGFREVGDNHGIEKYIGAAHTGSLGDPWCAIFINAMLENVGIKGSRSPSARSFEKNANFVKLSKPALGAITTMWRGSPTAGTGHVFFYDGESTKGERGIGGNEDNVVKRSFHDRTRVTGHWWPKSEPLPSVGSIPVSDTTTVVTRTEV